MDERILLLSWTIPPETTGSAIIVGNLAKQFSRAEMVVAGERPWGRPAVAWRDDWPELVYVIMGWPRGLRGTRWWRWLQFPVLLLRCLLLVWKHRCTTVLVVFPKEDFLLAGYLTALCSGTKLVPYFHNTYVENRTGASLRFARWLQRRVFARAACVFVMSEGMVDLYRERYPGLACAALPHAFNEAFPAADAVAPPPPAASRTPFRFFISGSVNESCRDAIVRACAAIAQVTDATLTLLSGTPEAYLRQLGILRDGVRRETVSRDDVIARLGQADVVVLAHGFEGQLADEEYRTIFPTKTIEYLICGRPILAHAPADCYLTRFLVEHDCALVVTEPTTGALLAAIARLRTDAALRARLVRNAFEAARVFRAPRVAAILRTTLQEA
jgi:glycosyltransferase involved in cell wall biosynthesis